MDNQSQEIFLDSKGKKTTPWRLKHDKSNAAIWWDGVEHSNLMGGDQEQQYDVGGFESDN